MRAYTRLVTQLLCLLLRAKNELNLPAEIKELVATLHKTLDQDIDDAEKAVHQLLLTLWMQEWTPSMETLFPDPTLQFIIHTQVNRDGSLKKPEDATGIFAKLIYNMVHCYFYYT